MNTAVIVILKKQLYSKLANTALRTV